jgi:hypothetical protein
LAGGSYLCVGQKINASEPSWRALPWPCGATLAGLRLPLVGTVELTADLLEVEAQPPARAAEARAAKLARMGVDPIAVDAELLRHDRRIDVPHSAGLAALLQQLDDSGGDSLNVLVVQALRVRKDRARRAANTRSPAKI